MKITIIIPSNRPTLMRRFLSTFHKLGALRDSVQIHLSHQEPWEVDDVLDLHHRGLISTHTLHEPANPTRMIEWRRAGMAMNPDADYYWFLDDDHQFADSSKDGTFTKTCEEYYSEVFDYLKSNPDVGVMTCRGYFGGYAWGYEIKKNPTNGILATDKGGLFIKNIGIEKICPSKLIENRGALFESVFGYNVISHGYNTARRYNCPTKSTPPGKGKKIGNSKIATYSDDIVNSNNQKYIREAFGDPLWCHSSKKYPKDIAKMLGVKQ